jgi:hypothetical protein
VKNKLRWIGLLALPLLFGMQPMQPLTPTKTDGANDQVLAQLNLKTFAYSWNVETTARYVFVFDATTLPNNGTVTNCSTSHVTGCALWCRYTTNSGTAPGDDWADWGSVPISAKFGLIIAVSTGAGCQTFTTDAGSQTANSIVSQAY